MPNDDHLGQPLVLRGYHFVDQPPQLRSSRDHVVGMPISIVESMATGGYVIARDLPGMADYVGEAGALYDGATVEERAAAAAALVRATTDWSDEQWAQAQERAIEQAFRRHAGSDVAERMLRTWQATFPQLRR